MSAAPRALVLDFGGVLTSDFHAALRDFSQRRGLAPDALTKAMNEHPDGRRAYVDAGRGRIPQPEFEAVIAEILGFAEPRWMADVFAPLRPNQAMLDYLAEVRAAGIPTGMLSNSWGGGGIDVYAGYPLPDLFTQIVISHQVGLAKPDPAIYRLTADRLGLPPDRCVFVDDTERNLPPARALGMPTIHFTDPTRDLPRIAEALAS